MRLHQIVPRSIAVLFAAALAAVTCDDARPVTPLAEQLAAAFCAHQLSCCSPFELSLVTSDRYATEEACLPFALLAAHQQLGAIEGAMAEGRITVDPDKLEACVASYRASACNTSRQSPLPVSALPDLGTALVACPDLFVGHVPNNQACGLSQECVAGSRCVGGQPPPSYGNYPGLPIPVQLTPTTGLCLPYQQNGDRCNESSDCDPRHSCRTPEFVCGAPTGEGEPCTPVLSPIIGIVTSNCDVNAHLFCDDAFTFTCRHYPRAGEPCDQVRSPQCDPDPALALACDFFSGLCKPPGQPGDDCGGDAIARCRDDLVCHPTQPDGIGVCGSAPRLGEACTDRCASPSVCTNGLCASPGAVKIGSPCIRDTDCASLACTGFLSGRFVCAASPIQAVCVGAGVTPGVVTGVGGIGGTGTGGRGLPTGIGGSTGGRGTAGSGGAGGAPPLGCLFSDPAPQDPIIADFDGADATMMLPIGGIFTYTAPTAVAGGPIATITNGGLHVTAQTKGTTTPQFWGAGIYFNGNPGGTECIDGSVHFGVQFDVSGALTGDGCTLQYSTNDSAHLENAIDPAKGSGPAGSYPPQAAFSPAATTTTIMMPFTGPAAPSGGSPAIAIDSAKLVGVQWQLTTPAVPGATCSLDLTIDNVRFF
jgi:hypothetical protein